MVVALLIVLLALSLTALVVTYNRAVVLTETLERVTDKLDDALDVIDKSFADVMYVSTLPIALDDPNVRLVVAATRSVRNALVSAANTITQIDEDVDNE